MDIPNWYQSLIKPSWAPPSFLFGPVWSVLYVIIFISYFSVFNQYLKGKVSFAVLLPFILNLIFNFIFSPIQFNLQNNYLALIDIVLVLFTLIWALSVVYPHFKWVTFANIPYLIWVIFATVLQATITYLNR